MYTEIWIWFFLIKSQNGNLNSSYKELQGVENVPWDIILVLLITSQSFNIKISYKDF